MPVREAQDGSFFLKRRWPGKESSSVISRKDRSARRPTPRCTGRGPACCRLASAILLGVRVRAGELGSVRRLMLSRSRETVRSIQWRQAFLYIQLLGLAMLGTCAQRSRETRGAFAIERTREEAFGHSHTESVLRYGRRILTKTLLASSADPGNPRRIIYSSREPGETVIFDGLSHRRTVVALCSLTFESLHEGQGIRYPWSPSGRFVAFGNDVGSPHVLELASGRVSDLTQLINASGQRLEMQALTWSPVDDRLAVLVQPGGYNDPDRDLVEISLHPLTVRYLGTKTDNQGKGLILWESGDYGWTPNGLVLASGVRATIRQNAQLRWRIGPPTTPTLPLDRSGCVDSGA
jgi:hypothetical protein